MPLRKLLLEVSVYQECSKEAAKSGLNSVNNGEVPRPAAFVNQ